MTPGKNRETLKFLDAIFYQIIWFMHLEDLLIIYSIVYIRLIISGTLSNIFIVTINILMNIFIGQF